MKKVISIALALVMMLAVCVPAFAAGKTLNGTPGEDGTVTVKTTKSASDSSYTVEIPADTNIPWRTLTTIKLNYTVSTQFETGKRLEVTVTGNGVMTDANGKELIYTLGGATTYTTDREVVKNASQELTIDIAETAWDNAVISEYQDTLTFTATVK